MALVKCLKLIKHELCRIRNRDNNVCAHNLLHICGAKRMTGKKNDDGMAVLIYIVLAVGGQKH